MSHSIEFMHDEAFHHQHEAILIPPRAHLGSDQEEVDKSTIHQTHRQNLVRLDLLRPNFRKPKRGELPDFDEETGMMKARGYDLTGLGRLLLRQLKLIENH